MHKYTMDAIKSKKSLRNAKEPEADWYRQMPADVIV